MAVSTMLTGYYTANPHISSKVLNNLQRFFGYPLHVRQGSAAYKLLTGSRISPEEKVQMDNDDRQIGHILSRRELLCCSAPPAL